MRVRLEVLGDLSVAGFVPVHGEFDLTDEEHHIIGRAWTEGSGGAVTIMARVDDPEARRRIWGDTPISISLGPVEPGAEPVRGSDDGPR